MKWWLTMPIWHELLLLLVTLLINFPVYHTQDTYYIKSTPDTLCPGEPCHTLFEYALANFSSNTNVTLVFLPGDHILNYTVSVGTVSTFEGNTSPYLPDYYYSMHPSLTLLGNSSSLPEVTSRIVCTWPAGFVFSGMTELHINALAFVSCGHNDSAAVSIQSVQSVSISNCTFQGNINSRPELSTDGFGGAIHVRNSTLTLVGNSFQRNFAYQGGALGAYANSILTLSQNIFQNNFADYSGGAVYIQKYNTFTLSINMFQSNSAVYGGALGIFKSSIFTLSKNIFQNNSADYGGAVFASKNNTLTLSENTFHNNSADNSGGALYAHEHNSLTVSENKFQMNSAIYGGAYSAYTNNTISLSGNSFQSNFAGYGGALEIVINNTLILSESTFQNNSAVVYGGALFASTNSSLVLVGNMFMNCISYGGGALFVSQSTIHLTDNILVGNAAQSFGGAIFCLKNSSLDMQGSHTLHNNTAQYSGGGIAALECQMTLAGDLIFETNTANFGGGIYADQSWVNGYAKFSNNVAAEDGGGIYASRSNFYLKECITFVGNSALNGGGLLLTGDSNLYLQPNTTINFTNNVAKYKGGAIKSDSFRLCGEIPCGFIVESECFFQIQTHRKFDIFNISEITELRDISLYFYNNTASDAGAALYGGSVDNCSLNFVNQQLGYNGFQPHRCPNSGEVFDYITNFDEQSQSMSSDPLYICTCDDGEPDCSFPSITRSVYPGGTIGIPTTAYGQRSGITPAVIHVTAQDKITIDELQNTQSITHICTVLQYTVQTDQVGTTQRMTLYADNLCPPKERTVASEPTNAINVHVEILKCPPGFELSTIELVCVCARRLQQFTNTCRLDDKKIDRTINTEFWVGYLRDNTSDGLILHPHCPLDYCTSKKLYVAVEDSDQQCRNSRIGLLCGKCSQNFSLVLGTNRCLKCSNDYLWLIVAFAFAGIALVFLLLVLRLTVAAGTINGLIFYANIFAMNSATFSRAHNTNILTVFIAWLNLDLGLETCFYDGMDAYTKAWLQFVFPFYVWALVGVIMLVSHYSSKVATILGTNPIAVLATLFLLSYAKFLRTIIVALSYTLLEYPNNSKITVWLYDGNIKYLGNEHIPLFIAALVCLTVLFFPYTIFLIFSQCLRSKSGWCKIFSWVNHYRVLPFLDAYHAPYTDKHRYWAGLMLLVRCILFFAFALNALGDPSVNLLASGSISAMLLLLYALLGNKVYKAWYLNALELSFIANLCIFSLASLYILSTGGNQNTVTLTSIAVTFATFIGIITYHVVQQIKNIPQLWKRMFPSNDNYECIPKYRNDSHLEGMGTLSPPDQPYRRANVTYTDLMLDLSNDIGLREPCMETDN